MEGERSSQTATTTQLHHWQEAPRRPGKRRYISFPGPNIRHNEWTRDLRLCEEPIRSRLAGYNTLNMAACLRRVNVCAALG